MRCPELDTALLVAMELVGEVAGGDHLKEARRERIPCMPAGGGHAAPDVPGEAIGGEQGTVAPVDGLDVCKAQLQQGTGDRTRATAEVQGPPPAGRAETDGAGNRRELTVTRRGKDQQVGPEDGWILQIVGADEATLGVETPGDLSKGQDDIVGLLDGEPIAWRQSTEVAPERHRRLQGGEHPRILRRPGQEEKTRGRIPAMRIPLARLRLRDMIDPVRMEVLALCLLAVGLAGCDMEPPLAFEGKDCEGLTGAGRAIDVELAAQLQALAVQGSGKQIEQHRELPVFTVVCLSVPLPVRIKSGTTQDVLLRVDDNIAEGILTRVSAGRLVVESLSPFVSSPDSEIVINAPGLRSLTLHGNGRVEVGGVEGESLRIQVDGVGSVAAYGRVERADLVVLGAGKVDGTGLKSGYGRALVDGVGSAKLAATEKAVVTVKGMGLIELIGEPKKRKEKLEGFGKITLVQ